MSDAIHTSTPELLHVLTCALQRCDALGLRGKKRDDEALSFLCGASTAAETCGNTVLGNRLAMTAAMVVAVRGYSGLVEVHANVAKQALAKESSHV